MKVFAGMLAAVAMILGQIVAFHIVKSVVPDYMGMWVAAVVLTWVGIAAGAIAD